MGHRIGNPNRGTFGFQLAPGIFILGGPGDPNAIADGADVNSGCVAASPGSLFLRTDGGAATTLYVKTALPNTWTAK
jgi:hypothetical protein